MAKKQKTPTIKEQMYQSVVNAQVKQALQNNSMAQFQNEFDAWKANNDTANSDGFKAFQNEFDNWANAQPKSQPSTQASTQIKSVVNPVTFKTAEERRAYKEKTTVKKPGSYDESKSYASTYGNKPGRSSTSGLQQIPKLNDYFSQLGAQGPTADINQVRASLEQLEKDKAQSQSNYEKAQSYLDPNKKLTKEEAKAARKLAVEGLKEFRNVDPKTLSAEELQRREAFTDLQAKASTLIPMSVGVANKGVHMGLSAAKLGALSLPVFSQKATDAINNLEDKWDETAAPSIEFAQSAAPIASIDVGKAVRNASLLGGGMGAPSTLIPDSLWDKMNNKVDINPYETGEMATMFASYMLTNPLFDKIAGGEKAGRFAKFAINQLGQNLQDIALDTSQVVEQGLKDGSIDAAEAKEIRDNIFWNAVFNAALGVGSEALKGPGKQAANVADADNIVRQASIQAPSANDLYRQNALEGLDRMQKVNQGYEFGYHNTSPENVLRSAEDVTEVTNKQFSDLMNQYNGEFQDTSAMREIYSPDNLDASMNRQLAEALQNNPRTVLPEVEAPKITPEPENIIPEVAKNTQETVLKPRKQRIYLPDDVAEKIGSDLVEIRDASESMRVAAENIGTEQAIAKYNRLSEAIENYEQALYYSDDLAEVNKAKKAADAARQALYREIKKSDPNFKSDLTGTKIGNAEYRRTSQAASEQTAKELGESIADADRELNTNQWVRDAEPDSQIPLRGVEDANKRSNVPGAEPLQFFGGGKSNDKWATSKYRTNTIENMGMGEHLPEKDFAYRVFTTAEQHEVAQLRNDSLKDLLNKETFDAPDIKAAMEMQKQFNDSGDYRSLNRLARKTQFQETEHGRAIQALAEYNKDTALGAIQDAVSAQDDVIVNPWKSRNQTKVARNSRIAKALEDLGNKNAYKSNGGVELTHDQIKKGVIAEIEKEVGSVEKYFNDNDIEFLTQMAEDKSIPVWQITSEIEHKLKTGNWYTLDESIELPKPTNRKLQNALNSLVTETIRAEKDAPTIKQITEEVRNTLAKEMADFESQFTDDDIDYLANLIHEGVSSQELSDMLNLKMATGSFGISDETLQEVNNIFKQISNYDVNSKQFVEGQAEAYRLLANELIPNATAMEKFEAWRYLAMLGNPKTMLRNFIGNQTFGAVTGISNNLAAIAEAGVDKAAKALGGEGIQRTKSILNPITDGNLIKMCAEDADASRYRQIIGSKYEKMDKNVLRQSKSVFNSKWAQLYEKLTDAGISDYKAVKSKYSTSLAGYLKANSMDTSIFKSEDQLARLKELSKTNVLSDAQRAEMNRLTKEVSELNKARDYALKQAEYATFHEDNKIAKTLTKWSRISKEEGTGIGNILIEGMIPFKKTPANVLKSGLEYSPFGAIDSIRRTGKLIYENTGKRASELADVYKNRAGKDVARTLASDVIESWAKTLTGTGLTALGFYLHNKGIIHSSDADTKYQDQLEGHQNYAIEINGKSYTIDWAAPSVMPLMVGAELSKLWSATGKDTEDAYNNIDAYVDAFNKITDPLVETSMLSGVKDTLETAANYAKNNETINILPLLGYNLATGYMTQGVPTIAGQVARTIDPTRRATYTDKTGVAGVLDKQVKKQMNKIPGLSTLNEPYVDTYGREQQNSPFNNPVGNLAYQMLSPGYLSDINETGADRVSREAYDVNKAAGALPKYQSSFKDSEGNRVSPSDFTTASRAYGQANFDIRQSLSEDKWFNNLDAVQKEEVIKKINSIAEHVGKAAIDPEYATNSKGYNLYTEGGIPSLKEYFKEETDKSTAKGLLGDSGVRTNSNAGKAVVEAVSNGNMEEAKRLADQAAKDKAAGTTTKSGSTSASSSSNDQKSQFKADFGSNGSNVYKLYENAKTIDPNTSAATYRGNYKAIDKLGDSNGSVSQKEFLQYLQNGDYSEAEAQKLAKMYGSWTKIPKLENGTWKFKKSK